MSFFTDEERDAIRVTRMILHVVGKKDAPFVREPEIPVQQEEFFRSRVLGAAGSGVHSFTEHSQVRPLFEQMAAGALPSKRADRNFPGYFGAITSKRALAERSSFSSSATARTEQSFTP